MTSDPIANFIIAIKNAGNAGKESVITPFSELKFSIAKLLEHEGYLEGVTKKGKRVRKFIEANVVYDGREPHVKGVRRISKPGRRVYYGVTDVKPVRYGYGALVLSTPKGIVTGTEAKRVRVGGEALFEIW